MQKKVKSILSSLGSLVAVIFLILGFTGKLDGVGSELGYGKDDKESVIIENGNDAEEEDGEKIVIKENDIATSKDIPIVSGLTEDTWVREEDSVVKYVNISFNGETGTITVECFAADYSGAVLDEYNLTKELIVEETDEWTMYFAEDGSMDINADYCEITDYETGFYDGYYSWYGELLVNEEYTPEIIEVSAEEAKEFFRDVDNMGKEISIVLEYHWDSGTYHTWSVYGDSDLGIYTNQQSSVLLFSNDIIYVTGIYKGIDETFGNFPYIELTSLEIIQ